MPGLHSAEEPWHPTEAEKIFELSQAYGVPIEAVEFANEPNMLEDTGFQKVTLLHITVVTKIYFSNGWKNIIQIV